jgi:hypothetical protein
MIEEARRAGLAVALIAVIYVSMPVMLYGSYANGGGDGHIVGLVGPSSFEG